MQTQYPIVRYHRCNIIPFLKRWHCFDIRPLQGRVSLNAFFLLILNPFGVLNNNSADQ
jgi:hypothetical protein